MLCLCVYLLVFCLHICQHHVHSVTVEGKKDTQSSYKLNYILMWTAMGVLRIKSQFRATSALDYWTSFQTWRVDFFFLLGHDGTKKFQIMEYFGNFNLYMYVTICVC